MILPDWTGTSFDRTVIVSALAYEAIKRGTKVNYKTVFGKINIQTKDVCWISLQTKVSYKSTYM